MVRLCGRPALEYIMDLLIENGIDEAAVTLGYMPEVIRSHFNDNGYKGLRLSFCCEDTPLGTAGGAKNAARLFQDDTFVIISGDAVCDYEINKIVQYHKSKNADATIVLSEVDDPREYGLVRCGEDGEVTGFVEKPPWEQVNCATANTGIYIVNSSCFSLVPDNTSFDFAKDLFPLMMKNSMRIYGYKESGYWCDIGNTSAYLKCQRDLLSGRLRIRPEGGGENGVYGCNELPKGNYTVIPPVYIGRGVTIGDGAVIGAGSVIDYGCSIGKNVRLRSSVVLQGVRIDGGSSLGDALVCSGVHIKKNVSVYEGAVLGSDCVIGECSTVKPFVSVWPGRSVLPGTVVSKNIKFADLRRELFENSGICADFFEFNAENCARLGRAVGSSEYGAKVGIACAPSNQAKALKYAIASGLMLSGSHVWDFGECFKSQLDFFTCFCSLNIGIFIGSDENGEIIFCGRGGMPLQRYIQREIESGFFSGDFKMGAAVVCRDISDMSSIRMMYNQELSRSAPSGLCGISVSVESPNESVKCLFSECVTRLGGKIGGETQIIIDKYGERLNVCTPQSGCVPYERLTAVCALDEFKAYKDVIMPYDAPRIIDSIADNFNTSVLRYLNCPADDSDSEIRLLASKQLWTRDALFMGIKLLSVMKKNDLSLDDLLGEIPQFYVSKRTVHTDLPAARLSEYFKNATVMPQGIIINENSSAVSVVPLSTGLGFRLLAEAGKMEIADEICADMEKRISEISGSVNLDNGNIKE